MKVRLNYENPQKVRTDLLVVILDKETKLHEFGRSPLAKSVDQAKRAFRTRRLRRERLTTLNPRSSAQNLVIYSTSLDPGFNVWENLKTYVNRSIRLARELGLRRVSVVLNTNQAVPFVGKAVEAAILGSYSFGRYKKNNEEDQKAFSRMTVEIVCLKDHHEHNQFHLNRYKTVSEAVNFARDLINEPGSVVTPQRLAEEATEIASTENLDLKIWEEKQLVKEGFTGLISVGKGSINKPRLIRLKYNSSQSDKCLALVGKGITFDTGGISIKPADKMWEMKADMSGGAAVLGAMKAISQLKPAVNVVGIIPAAENSVDAQAQRPGDIFVARNGKSIMVDNTDAEGRLVLTDGLFQAGEEGATHIVDVATLTGACIRALGFSIAGIMGNSPELIQSVIASGQNHGEEFWELPLPNEYISMLKTPHADLNNIGGAVAGATTAGLFLKEFVPEKTPWAHLDIAGPAFQGKAWKYYEAGGIGFGVKTFIDLAERFNEYFNSDNG